jgi:hypothetical protein
MVPIAPSIIRMRSARSAFKVASVDIQNSQTGFQNVQYFSRKAG